MNGGGGPLDRLLADRKPCPEFLPGDLVCDGHFRIARVVWDRGCWLYIAVPVDRARAQAVTALQVAA